MVYHTRVTVTQRAEDAKYIVMRGLARMCTPSFVRDTHCRGAKPYGRVCATSRDEGATSQMKEPPANGSNGIAAQAPSHALEVAARRHRGGLLSVHDAAAHVPPMPAAFVLGTAFSNLEER